MNDYRNSYTGDPTKDESCRDCGLRGHPLSIIVTCITYILAYRANFASIEI